MKDINSQCIRSLRFVGNKRNGDHFLQHIKAEESEVKYVCCVECIFLPPLFTWNKSQCVLKNPVFRRYNLKLSSAMSNEAYFSCAHSVPTIPIFHFLPTSLTITNHNSVVPPQTWESFYFVLAYPWATHQCMQSQLPLTHTSNPTNAARLPALAHAQLL